MKLNKKFFTTVTPFSKLVALILFSAFPFIGFFLGINYQKNLDFINTTARLTNLAPSNPSYKATHKPSPTHWPDYLSMKQPKTFKDNENLGISFEYPSSLKFQKITHPGGGGVVFEIGELLSPYTENAYLDNGEILDYQEPVYGIKLAIEDSTINVMTPEHNPINQMYPGPSYTHDLSLTLSDLKLPEGATTRTSVLKSDSHLDGAITVSFEIFIPVAQNNTNKLSYLRLDCSDYSESGQCQYIMPQILSTLRIQ